jgi:hypothetical protein
MENGNGFPLSMKVAYAKDLLVAKVAETPTEAVAMVEHLMKGFGQQVAHAEPIQGAGPFPQPEKKAAPPPPQAQQSSEGGPDLKADVVRVLGWAKEPKTGTKKNGKGQWWKLGVKVNFPTLQKDDWLVVWSPKKAEHLQKNKNQHVPITFSVGAYEGKEQYTLEGIDGLEE